MDYEAESWIAFISRGSELFFSFPLFLIGLWFLRISIQAARKDGYSLTDDINDVVDSLFTRRRKDNPDAEPYNKGPSFIYPAVFLAITGWFCFNGLVALGWWQRFWGGVGLRLGV